VIGGTAFVGRAVVEEALTRGFQITTFNRGQTNPDLFPQVEKRHGDRDGGLDALGNGEWDLVVDTCGYLPQVVGQSVALLANSAGWYSFISSLAVFADFSGAGLHEDSPLAPLPNPPSQEFLANYGPLKVLCEQTVLGGFPDHHPARTDRRPQRQDRPVWLLAQPCRRRWRYAGARSATAAHTVY